MKPLLLLAALPALLSLTAHAAPQLRCHTRYNGESRTHLIAPVASPYGVEGVTLGERFVFRVVFQNAPADIAAVKVYTAVLPDEGPPQPVHQATYRWPVAAGRQHEEQGFTGLQRFFEPTYNGHLEYWCETLGRAAR